MRRTAVALTVTTAVAASAGCGSRTPRTDPAGPSKEVAAKPAGEGGGAAGAGEAGGPEAPAGEDVLAQVLEMNSDKYARPSSKFRRGHVTKRTAPRARKTKTGYEIKFPSGAPITTPAFYDGRIYVSGGFHSKEFYAFEATTGKATWAINLDDDGPSTSACADRVCVFNTESCTVFAVDSRSGEQLWSWWLGDPLTSAPTIAGGLVFTSYPAAAVEGDKPRPPNASHALIAMDLHTGKIKWQRWLEGDVMSAPVVAGEFLYVSTFAGVVMKLEPATGKFRYAVKVRATSAPVIQWENGRESMYYTRRSAAEDESINGAAEMIIRADDNSPKTRYKAKKKKAKYIEWKNNEQSAEGEKGKDQDSANGFSGGGPASANAGAAMQIVGKGSVSTMQAFQGSRILHMGQTNVNTMGDEVVATNAEDGAELWSFKLDGDVAQEGGHLGTAPLAAGGRVLVATLEGQVLEIAPSTGKVTRRHEVGSRVRAQPVVADGWIFVGTEDGRLVAIDSGDRGLSGWPMWGGNAARTGIVASK